MQPHPADQIDQIDHTDQHKDLADKSDQVDVEPAYGSQPVRFGLLDRIGRLHRSHLRSVEIFLRVDLPGFIFPDYLDCAL